MLSEFELIARYFTRPPIKDGPVSLGVGDDCALMMPPAGEELAISTDMLVEGRHFFAGADPYQLGHKCLAVNLSDLAAMGARPLGFTLALALPSVDEAWLAAFSAGMLALAEAHHIELIGGDTTKGPLTLSITVFGSVPAATALRRDGARAGDDLWVSGSLGDARLALAMLQGGATIDSSLVEAAELRLHRPTPRVALGLALRGIAHAAIDISDGLMGDLGHVLKRSGVGALINADTLPVGPALLQQALVTRRAYALNGGDDYELCFSAPVSAREVVRTAALDCATPVARIGSITAQAGLVISDANGQPLPIFADSFDHFTHS